MFCELLLLLSAKLFLPIKLAIFLLFLSKDDLNLLAERPKCCMSLFVPLYF